MHCTLRYEVCYWSHILVAYVTILVALIARFDVFWPCTVCWGLYFIDRWVLMPSQTYPMYVQANDCRVVEGDKATGRSPKLRLVLRSTNHATAQRINMQGASNWLYLRINVGLNDRAGMAERRVLRAWHPLSIAGTSNGNVRSMRLKPHDK